MKTMSEFLVASVALAMSLSASAGVSHVFVSNDDQTMSLIRCVTSDGKKPIKCVEKERQDVGFGTSWPANQYRGHPAWWWTGLGGEVIGIKAKASLSPLLNDANALMPVNTYDLPGAPIKTGSRSNFIGISPDGRTAWNSAREIDEIQEIITDPAHPDFGTISARIFVEDKDPDGPGPSGTLGAARPCDATITPDGRYFMEPDLGGESLTVVDTLTKEVIWQVIPPQAFPDAEDPRVQPFMATTNGKIVLVENLEGPNTYDIWDIRNLPAEPEHLVKLTKADGLGFNAQTSEFTPDGRYAYLIMNGSTNPEPGDESRLDVLDVDETSGTYLQILGSIALPDNCRASNGDFSNDGRFFFVNCNGADSVAVVDTETGAVVTTVPVGPSPRGLVVR